MQCVLTRLDHARQSWETAEDSASTAISSRHANARDDAIAISRHADAHHANARDDAISRHANARDDANAKPRRDDADASHADSGGRG